MNTTSRAHCGLTGGRGTRGGCGGRSSDFTLPPDLARYHPTQQLVHRSDHDELVIAVSNVPRVLEPILTSPQTARSIESHINMPKLRVRVVLSDSSPSDIPTNLNQPGKNALHFALRDRNLGFTVGGDPDSLTIFFDPSAPGSSNRGSSARFTGCEVLVLRVLEPDLLWYVCLMKSKHPDWVVSRVNPPSGVQFEVSGKKE